MTITTTKVIEHVTYHRFIVRYTLATGQRRKLVHWSPALMYAYQEVGRRLEDMFGLDGIKAGSVTVVES